MVSLEKTPWSSSFKIIPQSRKLIILSLLILLGACEQGEENDRLFLERSAQETGLDFTNELTTTPGLNILNYIYFFP